MIALDKASGTRIWEFAVPGGIHSTPAVHEGIVFFGSDGGTFYGLDAASGREVWKFKSDREIMSDPVVADGVLYFGGFDGKVYAFE